MSRIYAIGDIHGQAGMLGVALTHLQSRVRPYDTVVFLGDYIDRGPDSADVIQQVLRFRKKHKPTVFLRGNHEDMFMRAFADGDPQTEMQWLTNGGHATLTSFGAHGNPDWRRRIPRWTIDFLNDTEMEHLTERFHFVHAGILPPGAESGLPEGQDPRMWIRGPFIRSNFQQGRVVVFGHTVVPEGKPLIHPNKVGIDTGACIPGGKLTVACFNDLRSRVVAPQFDFLQILQDGSVLEQNSADEVPIMIAGPSLAPVAPVVNASQPAQAAPAKRSFLFWQPKAGQAR
jgi:serine/threonine protein phosphatase 1